MQMKEIKIKNLLCLSFHMLSTQNFFYLYYFFHLGLFYWSGSQISWLPWSGLVYKYQTESEQLAFLFTTPLNFQKRKANVYDFFATFCFIVVFVSLHQRQLHWRQFTFLKGEGMLFSFILFYFIIIFHFNFYTFTTSKKIIEKFCKSYSTNVLIESNFWLNKILAMYLRASAWETGSGLEIGVGRFGSNLVHLVNMETCAICQSFSSIALIWVEF